MMLKTAIIFLVIMFGFTGISAGEKPVNTDHPVLQLESREIDMGQLVSGGRVSGEIHITNAGSKDLLIGRVRSSCGLMIPIWPDEPIAEGNEVVIRFRYNTSRLGPFNRNIIIHSNGHPKTHVVKVTGEVIPSRKNDEP